MIATDFLFADKPAGVTTHTSLSDSETANLHLDPVDGFKEYLEEHLGFSIYVSHRLDKGTTGAIVFAKSPEAAETLRKLFEQHLVQKTYLFLTDRKIAASEIEIESRIERSEGHYYSEGAFSDDLGTAPKNAFTTMKLIDEDEGVFLWEATPATGKPHQIRLHAEAAGIPVLGDSEHGGSAFPALCLHSLELKFVVNHETHHFCSPPPRWFAARGLTHDPLLARWLAGVDRRERLLRSEEITERHIAFQQTCLPGLENRLPTSDRNQRTFRWLHTEGDPLRADQLGEVYSLSWFNNDFPSFREQQSLDTLISVLGWKTWSFQLRFNRGRAPNEKILVQSSPPPPRLWTACENGLVFEFRSDSGLSPGLFLDQRQNRKWVMKNSSGKKVLNLFSYTGGFSVAAAKAAACKVVSIDVSKNFLEWSKINFKLNHLPVDEHEFRAMDARDYLAWATKKKLRFDLVICDPPTFGRSAAGVFKIEKDFAALIHLLLGVTNPGGRILLSSNFEAWNNEDFLKQLTVAVSESEHLNENVQILRAPSPEWDFELPHQLRNMKSFFLLK